MKKTKFQLVILIVLTSCISCVKKQSKNNLETEKVRYYSGKHYGGSNHSKSHEYFIEESTSQKGDTTISKQLWYFKNVIRAVSKPARVKIVKFIEKDSRFTFLNESYKLDNGFMQHHWQTLIKGDSIYSSYYRNNNLTSIEEKSAKLKDLPVMTSLSTSLYLKRLPLHRNFEKSILLDNLRPFVIKVVDEVDVFVEGYGLMNCFYIYVISEDESNDEEIRLYIDKKTKEIVSQEYIVHESNSTDNTFPKSTGYEVLVDKEYKVDLSDPSNNDQHDYIEAAFNYVNKSNDISNALITIEKAISIDTTYHTVQAKLKLMSYAGKEQDDITQFINKVVSSEKLSLNAFSFMARGFIVGDYKDLNITHSILSSNLKKNPDNSQLIFGMARFYSEKGDFKEAVEYANKAISLEETESRKENMITDLSKLEQEININ